MPQPCTICIHPSRPEIERLVVSGEPNRRIAAQFDVSEASIRRHRAAHLPQTLARAHEAQEVAHADTLLEEVQQGKSRSERLYAKAEEILEAALASKDPKTALQAIRTAAEALREARAYSELRGKVTGELGQAASCNAQVVIVVPALVPVGTNVPLAMKVSEQAGRRALTEGEGPVMNVPVLEAPKASRKLLPPGPYDGR